MVGNEMFIVSAKAFEAQCSRDRDVPDVRRRIQDIDPALDILWSGKDRDFWVVVRLRPGEGPNADGYPYPLFRVGANPRPDDVYAMVLARRLKGRAQEAGAAMRKEIEDEKAANAKKASEKFLPGWSEYAERIGRCDDNLTASSLIHDMAKEKRRAANDAN